MTNFDNNFDTYSNNTNEVCNISDSITHRNNVSDTTVYKHNTINNAYTVGSTIIDTTQNNTHSLALAPPAP